jgi:arylsulfatase A
MKDLVKFLMINVLILIIIAGSCLSLSAQDSRPNIILIMADDLGFETIGVNGGTSYPTPNIDKLAGEGIRFENAHSQPVCTPTRIQLMTGKYNVRNYFSFGKMDRDQVTFGNLLKDAGYKTAVAGKWQLGKEKDSPQHFGFETSCLWQQSLGRTDEDGHDTRFSNPTLQFNGEIKHFTNGEYGPDILSDFICDFIEENKEGPFFAYYPMLLTHCPFVPTPDSEDYNPTDPGSLTYKGEPKYFPDMVAYTDKLVGKIAAKVDELGISENTLIIFTGDNGTDQPIVSMLRGEKYPGGKHNTEDNGTWVPLIMRWDNTIEAGRECHDLIDFSDFLPTFCEMANIDLPSDFITDGVSFLPQLQGKKGNPREWIYCWYSKSAKIEDLRELARDKKYKLYTTGEFYNVKEDFFEKNPIPLHELNKEEKRAFKKLSKALDRYSNVRAENQ